MQSAKYKLLENQLCSDKKYVWQWISRFCDDLEFLEENLDKVDWNGLSENSNAGKFFVELDYKRMIKCFQPISKEISEYVFEPARMFRLSQAVEMDLADYLEYY